MNNGVGMNMFNYEWIKRKYYGLRRKARFELLGLGVALKENDEALLSMKNRHIGRRIFVIGNGPSLMRTDLSLLKDEITIGYNGIFLLYDKLGFIPTYYTVEDNLVAEDRADTINEMHGTTKIVPLDLSYCIRPDEYTVYINFIRSHKKFPRFSGSFARRVYWGGTVTMLNLQLAYYLGSREIYLIGIDHNYAPPAEMDEVSGCVINANTPDQNHFHPDYFGPGYRYHDPRVDRMEKAYHKAREFIENKGGTIYNATEGGKLEVFPRVKFNNILGE